MTHRSRIFGVLDYEVGRDLGFSFTISENLTRPGSTTLRPKDRFRFSVWVTNDSAMVLRWLRGLVEPTALAGFTPQPFAVPRLLPGERLRIATIEARIAPCPGGRIVRLDRIGDVSVSTTADVSAYRFRTSKPLSYAPAPGKEREASA